MKRLNHERGSKVQPAGTNKIYQKISKGSEQGTHDSFHVTPLSQAEIHQFNLLLRYIKYKPVSILSD